MRKRALKVVLVLVGLLFMAGVYPVAMDLWHGDASDTGDTMMMSLYLTLGIFLLLAVRNPSAHRSLISFFAWSSFAHAVVMSGLVACMLTPPRGVQEARERHSSPWGTMGGSPFSLTCAGHPRKIHVSDRACAYLILLLILVGRSP